MAKASPPSVVDSLFSQSQARFNVMKDHVAEMDRVRKGLDRLVGMGDVVTSDDVLDEMSELVAKGSDPKMFAAIMAGNPDANPPTPAMPQGGEALAGWLKQQDDTMTKYEEQLKPAMGLAQHQLGVSAMHKIVQHHVGASPASPGAMPTPNAPSSSLLQ